MTQLRLGLSHLREHKLNHNFQNCINPLCSCRMDIESTSHFFLPVHYLMIKHHSPEHSKQTWLQIHRICYGGGFTPRPPHCKLFFSISIWITRSILFSVTLSFIDLLIFWLNLGVLALANLKLEHLCRKIFGIFLFFLSFNWLYLGLYNLKVVCTQFFRYLYQDWLLHLKIYLYFNNFWSAK